MNNNDALQQCAAFLARAPALRGICLTVGHAGPAPFTAGLWAQGVTVRRTHLDLLGDTHLVCRAVFVLRVCLPFPSGDGDTALQNQQRLAELTDWVAVQSAAGRAPCFGTDPAGETFYAENARLERADAGAAALYTLRLTADYTTVLQGEADEN